MADTRIVCLAKPQSPSGRRSVPLVLDLYPNVVVRVSGTNGERLTHGSVAKMELAKLIGIVEKVTMLNIVTDALGMAVCKRQAPLDDRSPVSDLCASLVVAMSPPPPSGRA